MTTLRQLSYLVALAQELHFRRAAERMNVTQPTLSIQIQELERQLKASLVERNAGKVMLTPLGREIVERARSVLSDVEDIKNLAAASQHGFDGTIRVGVPPTLGPYLLPHIVPELHANHPDLKLYVKEGKPHDLQLELKEGVHDLVISPLPINHSDLVVVDLFREPLQVVTAPDHPFARRGQIERKDLAGQKVLAMERGHHLHDQVFYLCEEFKAEPLRDYEGTSLDTLRLMVGMGVGIAFLPALYIRSEIGDRGEIAVINLRASNLFRQIGLAWRQRSVHAQLFTEISDMVRTIAIDRLPEVIVNR
ncbi:MAG: hydrogen peroxide-inducible genes activator [Pseudomonadota bacterium]